MRIIVSILTIFFKMKFLNSKRPLTTNIFFQNLSSSSSSSSSAVIELPSSVDQFADIPKGFEKYFPKKDQQQQKSSPSPPPPPSEQKQNSGGQNSPRTGGFDFNAFKKANASSGGSSGGSGGGGKGY